MTLHEIDMSFGIKKYIWDIPRQIDQAEILFYTSMFIYLFIFNELTYGPKKDPRQLSDIFEHFSGSNDRNHRFGTEGCYRFF